MADQPDAGVRIQHFSNSSSYDEAGERRMDDRYRSSRAASSSHTMHRRVRQNSSGGLDESTRSYAKDIELKTAESVETQCPFIDDGSFIYFEECDGIGRYFGYNVDGGGESSSMPFRLQPEVLPEEGASVPMNCLLQIITKV